MLAVFPRSVAAAQELFVFTGSAICARKRSGRRCFGLSELTGRLKKSGCAKTKRVREADSGCERAVYRGRGDGWQGGFAYAGWGLLRLDSGSEGMKLPLRLPPQIRSSFLRDFLTHRLAPCFYLAVMA